MVLSLFVGSFSSFTPPSPATLWLPAPGGITLLLSTTTAERHGATHRGILLTYIRVISYITIRLKKPLLSFFVGLKSPAGTNCHFYRHLDLGNLKTFQGNHEVVKELIKFLTGILIYRFV